MTVAEAQQHAAAESRHLILLGRSRGVTLTCIVDEATFQRRMKRMKRMARTR